MPRVEYEDIISGTGRLNKDIFAKESDKTGIVFHINNERLMGGILLRSTKASTMMTNLVANDFLQETFLVPSYPEQQKIGAFFQGLDNLITLHQCEYIFEK